MAVVIADAGPLIALSRIGQLNILQQLFQQIIITETVRNEILINDHCKGKVAVQKAIESQWIKVEAVDLSNWRPINSGVDAGESSAIFLACQSLDSTLLIIDDQAGRAEARYQGVAIIGTAAIIGMAKEQGLIESAKDTLYGLRKAGYYIGENIIKLVLDDIGEAL